MGFDLGRTLVGYGDIPLSWQLLYRDALREVAVACGVDATEENLPVTRGVDRVGMSPRAKNSPATHGTTGRRAARSLAISPGCGPVDGLRCQHGQDRHARRANRS